VLRAGGIQLARSFSGMRAENETARPRPGRFWGVIRMRFSNSGERSEFPMAAVRPWLLRDKAGRAVFKGWWAGFAGNLSGGQSGGVGGGGSPGRGVVRGREGGTGRLPLARARGEDGGGGTDEGRQGRRAARPPMDSRGPRGGGLLAPLAPADAIGPPCRRSWAPVVIRDRGRSRPARHSMAALSGLRPHPSRPGGAPAKGYQQRRRWPLPRRWHGSPPPMNDWRLIVGPGSPRAHTTTPGDQGPRRSRRRPGPPPELDSGRQGGGRDDPRSNPQGGRIREAPRRILFIGAIWPRTSTGRPPHLWGGAQKPF